MEKQVDTRRIWIFLAFAFGIAWATGLVIYLTGGIVNSPKILGGSVSLALILEATAYMGAPMLAHILTRLVTHEGWKNVFLRPNFRKGWRYWLICWFGPGILTIVGMGFYFLIFPQYFDPALGVVQQLLGAAAARTGSPLSTINPWLIVFAQTVQALLIAPLLNGIATFGEEFGWRAYLQPRLLPLGARKAMLLMGVIWGVWHWPIIAMGHNYGLNYVGYPWLGMLMMVWFTFLLGVFLGWAVLRAGSVWPAVIGHAAINGIAGLSALLVKGNPNPLLGPAPVGIVGSIGFIIVVLLIWLSPRALSQPEKKEDSALSAPVSMEAN
jgi:uncharacterized protein